jgi:hypothetical protein
MEDRYGITFTMIGSSLHILRLFLFRNGFYRGRFGAARAAKAGDIMFCTLLGGIPLRPLVFLTSGALVIGRD